MSGLSTKLRQSVFSASRSAVIAAIPILAMTVFFGANWHLAFNLLAIFAGGCFVLVLISTFLNLRADESVELILTESHQQRLSTPMSGFIAMEYYGLFLNRTYVVFIAPDGLHGWKIAGITDGSSPMFFAPYEQTLKDDDLMTNLDAVRKFEQLKGGFFIPREQIASAEPNYKKKSGMGAIPHSGCVRVQLTSGQSREFILLGSVDVDAIQKSIMLGLSSSTSAGVQF